MRRQLAAILYADVVGYSRLTDLDEEKTLQSLRSNLDLFTSKIEEYSGQKIKEAGDAILAEFASTIDSVNCAIEFQSEMATLNLEVDDGDKFEFRIGINLGEVVHDHDDIFGDGVNLAARIQGLADAGGVCISSTVYEQAHGKVEQDFEDMGYRKVKNISRPLHVYRLRGSNLSDDVKSRPSFDFETFDTDRSSLITGGCQCGAVRYEISQPAAGTGICHCRMCQRSIGSVIDAWTAFPNDALHFTKGEPKYYESSLIAKRGFCDNCGSSLLLFYYAPTVSKLVIMMTACLDNPEDFAPAWHGCTESQLPWLDIHDDLPRTLSENSTDLNKRWESVGKSRPGDWK
jgi:class 3 adenylate cyclase